MSQRTPATRPAWYRFFMQRGEPDYRMEAEAAWDYMEDSPVLKDLARQCSAVCFGSPAQRPAVSRGTIRNFLQNAPQAIRLYDVNLRQNTLTGEAEYSREIVDYSFRTATIIKVNQFELLTVSDLLGTPGSVDQSPEGIRRRMDGLLKRFPARAIVVIRGTEGTIVLSRKGEFDLSTPVAIGRTPHPVGAGDACSAGILFGMLLVGIFILQWSLRTGWEPMSRLTHRPLRLYPKTL